MVTVSEIRVFFYKIVETRETVEIIREEIESEVLDFVPFKYFDRMLSNLQISLIWEEMHRRKLYSSWIKYWVWWRNQEMKQ